MKKRWLRKALTPFLMGLLVAGCIPTHPVQAGASNIVVDRSSFAEKIDTSLWNNQNSDVVAKDGKLVFPKESTDGTALITKTRAKESEYHKEVIRADVTMKITHMPKNQTFALALGLQSVEALMGENGNIEIQISNDSGLMAQAVVYDDNGDCHKIGKAVSGGSVGSELKLEVTVAKGNVLTASVNGKELCQEKIPVAGEGCVGFLQSGSCAVEVSDVKIVSHRYDRPENCDFTEDFEKETMNLNLLTSKMIHAGYGQLPSKTYIQEINGNRVFQFMNTSTTYLGTMYQYSNFELTFDVLQMQREMKEDKDGNMTAAQTDNFAISFGGDAADFTAYGYDNASDLLIFGGTSINSWHTGKSADAGAKGYNFGDSKCQKDFTVKLTVIDSYITVYMKWLNESKFTEVMKYQLNEETPCGYVHIWTTGRSSTFALDNLQMVNKDKNPNLVDVSYAGGLIEAPADFDYQPLEYVYKEAKVEKDYRPYIMVGAVVCICLLAFLTSAILKKKRKGGDSDAQI